MCSYVLCSNHAHCDNWILIGGLKAHDWLVIARCGILQHILVDELEPEVFDAVAGLLHQLALLTRGQVTTDPVQRARERDELVVALAWYELRMPATECTTLLHESVHLFDDGTDWGPGVNLWMFPNESYLGWLGGLINDRAHPIPNLLNMHRVFRALCDAPPDTLREMCAVIGRSSNNSFVQRVSKWVTRNQDARAWNVISIGRARSSTTPIGLDEIPLSTSVSGYHGLSVAMHGCSTTVAGLGNVFEEIAQRFVLRSRGRRCMSLLEWHGQGLHTVLSGRDWTAASKRLRSPLLLERVNTKLKVNGLDWDASWREDRHALTRSRCKSTFMMTGATLAQYATVSRAIDHEDPHRWYPSDSDTYYGRVLMFFRCRCHGMRSWKYLAAVKMQKASFGPFTGCATITSRTRSGPVYIVSVLHLQTRTISVPTPEPVRGAGNLSVLTYHEAKRLH